MESRGRRVHSIEKAIRLLDCFWEADSPLSLHELEQRTGWAKSTIHGLLATMLDSAVVEQNPTDGKYRLGYHLFELGSAVRQGWSVPELCRPHLRAMAARLGESVHLARLSGDELILVACEAPQRGFHMTSETARACRCTPARKARPFCPPCRSTRPRPCCAGGRCRSARRTP